MSLLLRFHGLQHLSDDQHELVELEMKTGLQLVELDTKMGL